MTPWPIELFTFFTVVLRAGILICQSLLLGGSLFLFHVVRISPGASLENTERIRASAWRLLRFSAIGLAIVQALYLYVNSRVLMATAEIGLAEVLGASFFLCGSVLLVAALLTMGVARCQERIANRAVPALALIILFASVMNSHAFARITGRPLAILLTCVHVLAVGFWIGGLPFLVLGLARATDVSTRWWLAKRFSKVAMVSVILLALSGAAMSVLYIGSSKAVLGTAYGVMVSAKVVMLAALLVLGGVNFLLLRKAPAQQALPRLRRLIEAEAGIGITVILTAASLTSLPPAVDQTNDTVTFQQILQRFRPAVPRLFWKRVPQSYQAQGYNLDGVPLTTHLINDAFESESNHHWMGLIVIAMGMLAIVAQYRKTSASASWPFLLICIAIFIFFFADSESWPVGTKGFWECWLNPEVFQHRMVAVFCVGISIFELRILKQRRDNDLRKLVFPLMCAAGGAVMLTHSHSAFSVKENLLAELSHASIGILAVFAGWSRWLELRLPERNRAIPSWIWPACFVLIGVALLNYREM